VKKNFILTLFFCEPVVCVVKIRFAGFPVRLSVVVKFLEGSGLEVCLLFFAGAGNQPAKNFCFPAEKVPE